MITEEKNQKQISRNVLNNLKSKATISILMYINLHGSYVDETLC